MTSMSPKDLVLVRDLRRGQTDAVASARPAREAELTRVRRGAYVPTALWNDARPAERYRLLVEATIGAMRSPAPLSHESAAVMLGIPIIGRWPQQVHVLEETASGGRASALVRRHGTRRMPDIVMVGGVAVTSVARTVLDLATTRPFASSLASADRALATGATTPEHLLEELENLRGIRGFSRARRVVQCADGAAESVGESLSRAQMYTLHMPIPELQHTFVDDDGFVARVDFWWRKLRSVGEFDGQLKYRRDAVAGMDPGDVVWQEKVREDRLRALVPRVGRWTWAVALDQRAFLAAMARIGVMPGDRP